MEDHLSTEASCTWEDSDWEGDFVEAMNLGENNDITDQESKISLATDLATWVSQFQVKSNAVDQHGHTDLPSSARTLLKTPRHVATIQKYGMEYLHYPLHQKLLDCLEKYPVEELQDHDTVNLSFNIDGLPLFKSSGKVMWPVLCAIHLNPIFVFPTTLTCGNKWPNDLHFLDDVVADLKDLLSSGIQCKGKKYSVNVLCIVCDAPAKAFVRSTKLYSGYYGCDKCDQKGERFKKVTFQDTENLTLCTDASFRTQVQPEHQNNSTPLVQLSTDMIKSFPIDYMHQACLGVMKRLLRIWTSGARGVRLSTTQKQEMDPFLASRQLALKEKSQTKRRDNHGQGLPGMPQCQKSLKTHHLSLIGGASPGECVRMVMRAVVTNIVWSHYSLLGKREKLPLIGTTVCKVIKLLVGGDQKTASSQREERDRQTRVFVSDP
ncbi:uncharacterized protein LOC127444588 [Myxocyprinus asiaticus]|uniref:uncharacterized protein LOC127444588 n=1 Tax=Myxocyprinus asiaticus TaxID=70543 RepID=UPI002221CDE0|nr:uncharacterized protein LOC127444588 [Myxocyprinus asiaticus]